MTDEKTKGKGSRIAGAKLKGAAAAEKGASRDANPYKRPNMAKAWHEGYDSFALAKTQDNLVAD